MAERDGARDALFDGTSEMAARCRAMDWAATPLGPVAGWPAALRTAVRLMLAAPVATSLWCGADYTLLYNDAYRRILGAKHPRALGRSGAAVWDELWPALEPQFEGIRAGGPAVYADEALLTMERLEGGRGEDAWFTYALSALTDEDGRCVAVYNVAVEITERVRAREAMATERARLYEAFRRVPSFVSVVTGPDHVIEYANEAYFAFVGRRDVLGKPMWEALPDARGQGFEALLDSVRETGVPVAGRGVSVRLVRAPGAEPEERFVDFVYQPLTDAQGRLWGVMGHGTDVTEQVLARRELELANQQLQDAAAELETQTAELQATAAQLEERTEDAERARAEVAASEEQWRTFANSLPTLAWTARADGYIEWYNARWYEYTGTTPAQMAGWGWQAVHDPAELPWVMETWQATIERGVATEMTFPLRGADGRFRRFLTRITPLTDAAGRVIRWIGTNTDVEAERAAREAAESANQAKTDFLATMSHELRTPLNAIAGYTELIEIGVHGPVTPEQREALGRIQRSQRHLLGLINDVLNFAKLEAGRVEYDLTDVSVREAVDAIESLVEPQLRAKALRFGRDACADGRVVRADPDKLQQILVNLLSNAIKFTSAGGAVTLRCEEEDGAVRIAVADTGIGIAADRLEHIFAPFVQVDRRLNAPQHGTGLGLAISRDLARAMGGDLTVESTPGEGSTFTVTLPSAKAERRPAEAATDERW